MLKNEDIESNQPFPMDVIFANQMLHWKPNGVQSRNSRETGGFSKNDHDSNYFIKGRIYSVSSEVPKPIDTRYIIDPMSRKPGHVHQNRIKFQRRNNDKRISIYNKDRKQTKLLRTLPIQIKMS